eukprot:PRCOL_00006688-RA
MRREYGLSTRLAHGFKPEDPFNASAPPLYQTATFGQPDAVSNGPYDYTRSGNPTRDLLQTQWADLEGADAAFAFNSGMAALAVVTRLCKAGDHVVAGDDLYGGTSRLLAQCAPAAGLRVTNVDHTDLEATRAAIQTPGTTMVMLESPTNPRMQVTDIAAIAAMAKEVGALVCVDNSIMTCLYQRPLELGADISMTSATKFVAGHSDVTGGLLAIKGEELAKRVYFFQNAEGSGMAPFECWLAARGLKTMGLRMERQVENCAKLAEWLAAHPKVTKLNYPGLPGHPFADVHDSQAKLGGSLLSFETGDLELSRRIVEETKLFKITVSFGSTNSLISLPCFMSHASIPAEVRAARGLPDDLVRISAGIEDIEDLIADLDAAFGA